MKCQLKVVSRLTSCAYAPPSKPGDVIWVTHAQAQQLVSSGVCAYMQDAFEAVYPVSTDGPLRRSADWPVNRFSAVSRVWDGCTVVCVGGGPSLTQQQVDAVQASGFKYIAINDSYRLAGFADIHYFADFHWWEWHHERPEFSAFSGQRCTIDGYGMMVPDPNIHMLKVAREREGLSNDPGSLVTGLNSGYQAINIAVLAGAARIVLLGYDMRYRGAKTHWHDGHPVSTPENNYSMYAKRFHTMVAPLKELNVEVINCTPDSALNAFPRADLESILSNT